MIMADNDDVLPDRNDPNIREVPIELGGTETAVPEPPNPRELL